MSYAQLGIQITVGPFIDNVSIFWKYTGPYNSVKDPYLLTAEEEASDPRFHGWSTWNPWRLITLLTGPMGLMFFS